MTIKRALRIAVRLGQEASSLFWWAIAPKAMKEAEAEAREALCDDPGLCLGETCQQGCEYWKEVWSPNSFRRRQGCVRGARLQAADQRGRA